jgi:hypothetical protein
MDNDFCVEALRESLLLATPDIFNTDQGCQFQKSLSPDFKSPCHQPGA